MTEMNHRKLGRTGLDVGIIGLGTEHIPWEADVLDRILGMAVDAGVNYADLLFIEPEYWEMFTPVLKPYRDKLIAAVHWGGGPTYNLTYSQRCFDDVLARLSNGYADVAMMTMVDTENKWRGWAQSSIERLQGYQEQGRVGYIGLSTHVEGVAVQAAESGLIDVLMFPFNLTSHATPQVQEVYRACTENDVGLVAMKVYRGGTLLVQQRKPTGITPAQCLAYVLSLPVSTTVPGPKDADQFAETLHYLTATEQEQAYGVLLEDVSRYLTGECTSCEHCLPCPEEIHISAVVHLTDWAGWADPESDEGAEVRLTYGALPVKASACIECGVCEERCPFAVEIMARMQKAVSIFGV